MRKQLILLFVVIILMMQVLGCGGGGGTVEQVVVTTPPAIPADPPSNQVTSNSFSVRSSADGQSVVFIQNGATMSEDVLKQMAYDSAVSHSDFEFELQGPEEDQSVAKPNAFTVAGRYRCMVRWERGYVGGCIKRNGWHLNLHIRDIKANRDVLNSHMMGWGENGPQFGIYNSANGYCATSRGKFTAIKDAIQRTIQNAVPYMPVWAAAAIATTVAYIAVPCLGLAF